MGFTPKQKEYFKCANSRWNVKAGATRSGKTYMDYYLIPKRIRSLCDKQGLVVILGNTKGTLQRNIIEPLQNIWGGSFVSNIRSDNTATLFGEKCYLLGADKISQVNRLRGSSIKYCYGDEVVTWHEDVFNMLKSRLDKPYSVFDGTCNPESKNHWFKKFLDSSADIYLQNYCIDDNPYLSESFVKNIKKEYFGTVYYDRYILGKWVNAEGIIYRAFNDNPTRFIVDKSYLDNADIVSAAIGIDFGGGTSAHAFNLTVFTRYFKEIITVCDYHRKDAATPDLLYADFESFLLKCRCLIGKVPIYNVYCDSAEQTLIAGLRAYALKRHLNATFRNALKRPINDRIRFYTAIMGASRYKILDTCTSTIDAFSEALWDSRYLTEDVRLDNGTTNIDNLDAQEYSTEAFMRDILDS